MWRNYWTVAVRALAKNRTYSVINIAGLAIGAKLGFIYLRGEYRYLLKIVEKAVADAYAKGFLMVSASPLTRSSYHAGDDFARLRAARLAQQGRVQ